MFHAGGVYGGSNGARSCETTPACRISGGDRVNGTVDERVGIVIVRAVVDTGAPMRLRVRITQVVDGRESPPTTVANVDDACAIVRASLNLWVPKTRALYRAKPGAATHWGRPMQSSRRSAVLVDQPTEHPFRQIGALRSITVPGSYIGGRCLRLWCARCSLKWRT